MNNRMPIAGAKTSTMSDFPDLASLVKTYSCQYDQHYENSSEEFALNKYNFLYKALFVPLLLRISKYLDKFKICYYKKGLNKDQCYIALPREDMMPFNKLLDYAAACFLYINRTTSTRSHAAQYVSDKQLLLGNEADFLTLLRPHQPSTVIYVTSDMEYVGCTVNAFKRRTQHIHNLMRQYLDLERSTLPIYSRTRAQGKLAMAKLCVLVPIEISSPLCKLTDEARSIRILCPSKNVRFGSFNPGCLKPKCMGSHERARRHGGVRYIPSIPKSERVDKTLFSILVRYEGQHTCEEFVSTRIEDIAKVWYQHGKFSISPGRFDNSCWTSILQAFRGSTFIRTDRNQYLSFTISKLFVVVNPLIHV